MVSKIFNLAAFCGAALLISACASSLPQYKVTQLNDDAKSLITAQSRPTGCMLLGNLEGVTYTTGTSGATMEKMRESARNDLRNNATPLLPLGAIRIGDGKRFLVYIDEGRTACRARGQKVDCATFDTQLTPFPIIEKSVEASYRVYGEAYECRY